MNRQLVLLPLALGSLALAGCSTAPSQTSGSDYSGQFTTASPAFAGSDSGPAAWSYFASATDGSSHYIDYNSIRRDGPRARVWARHEFEKTALSEGPRVRSARALRELDCSSQQWRLLSITVFSAPGLGGEQVSRHDGPGSWQQIPPRTVGAAKFRAVCS